MNLYKSLFAAAFTAAAALTFSVTAQAAHIPTVHTAVNGVVSETIANLDDPGYLKYLHNQQVNKSNCGSVLSIASDSNLTHNSRFAGYSKEYGIDVSQYQYDIDWNKVKQSGIKFAIIRIGYRGWGSAGYLCEDPYFKQNIAGAKKAGIKVGAYFYTQAITTAEAKAEARYCLQKLSGYGLDLPVYFDIEEVYTGSSDVGRMDGARLSKAQKAANARAFCETIKAGGYKASVYSYRYYLYNQIDAESLSKTYDIWLADYSNPTPYTGSYNMWQYSSSGYISGISARVDLNVRYIKPSTDAPTVKLTSRTYNSITFHWTKQADATGYLIYQKKDGTYKLIGQTNSCAYKVSDLEIGTAYSFKVKPFYNKNSDSTEYSSKASTMGNASAEFKDGTKLAGCKNVTVTAKSPTSALLTWDKSDKATSYTVFKYDPSSKSSVKLTDVTTNKATVTGLTPATAPYFVVTANYSIEEKTIYGNFSEAVQTVLRPSAVTGFTTQSRDSGIVLSWTAAQKNVTYSLYTKEGDTLTLYKEGSKLNYVSIKEPKKGTSYTYAVKACYEYGGKKYYSTIKEYTFVYKYSAVEELKTTKVYTSSSVQLNWTKTEGATGYNVYMYSPSQKKFVLKKTTNSKTLKATITGLKSNTGYYFKIKAVYGSHEAAASPKILAYTKPSAPKNLKTTAVYWTTANLAWSKTANATSYKIALYSKSGTLLKIFYSDKNKFNIPLYTLSMGTTYQVKIKAINKYNNIEYISDFSNKIVFTTK